MPIDTRRISGPETSQSPYNFCPDNSLDPNVLEKERPDGRTHIQLRPLFLRAGVISQARGSAYIEMNKTKVICAVYGPREVQRREDFSLKGQLTCDFKFTTFSCRQRRQHQQDSEERDLSCQLLEALEPAVCLHKYPKSQVNVYVTVLQHDGSALSAAIICASLALASAGIEMYDLVVASSVAMYGTSTIMDPTCQEEVAILEKSSRQEVNAGSLVVALLPSINQVSTVYSQGQVQFDTLNKSMRLCLENCQKLYPVIRQSLVKYLKENKMPPTESS